MDSPYSGAYDNYNRWLVPVNLAIGFHLFIVFAVVFLPGMFKAKPKFEDIYTVNLVTISEPAAQQPAPAAQPPVPKQEVKEPEAPPPKAVNLDPVPAAAPEPEAPVSLKPLKKKIKKAIEKTEPKIDRSAEQLKRQRLAEALRAEQQAAEQARLAAEEAVRQQQLLDRQLALLKQQRNAATASLPRAGGSSSNTLSILEKQYLAAIKDRINQFWSLPEFKHWDPSTQAVVVVSIAQNGTIVRLDFEQHSDDPTFDQFVRKTLHDADPLPAIPPALRKNSFEIGLRFRPGSIN